MHEWSYRRLSQLVRPYAWTMRTPGHWDGHAMGRTRPLRKQSWMRTRSRARQQQMLGKGGKALKEALTRKDILLRLCAPSIHVRLCRGERFAILAVSAFEVRFYLPQLKKRPVGVVREL